MFNNLAEHSFLVMTKTANLDHYICEFYSVPMDAKCQQEVTEGKRYSGGRAIWIAGIRFSPLKRSHTVS